MKLMTRGRFACAVLSWIGALTLLALAPQAMAQSAPAFSSALRFPFPAPGSSVIINLRDQGVLTGDPSILVNTGVYGEIRSDNGVPTLLDMEVFDFDPRTHGSVCIRITNLIPGHNPAEVGTLTANLGAINHMSQAATTGFPGLVVTNGDGPVVNSHMYASCEEPQPNRPPTANAGLDFTVSDTNGRAGESNVQLRGSASDPNADDLTYEWFLESGGARTRIGGGTLTPLVELPDGENSVILVVSDAAVSVEDRVVVTVNPNRRPIAVAGPDRRIAAGASIVLDSAGSNDPDGSIGRYEWFRVDNGQQSLGVGATLPVSLPSGVHTIRLIVTDNFELSGEDDARITVDEPVVELRADAGADLTVDDSDTQAGEDVQLDGSGSTFPEGSNVHYYWRRIVGGSRLALGDSDEPTLSAHLPDGESIVELLITGNSEDSSTDTVTITVRPPASSGLPIADAGADRTINDSDRTAGETVVLDASGSSDPNGTIANYTWSRMNGETTEELVSGTTAQLQARLPDGENTLRLVVTDNSENTASDTVVITVGAPTSSAPTANAGADRIVTDTDQQAGEDVLLDGSWSVDSDGTIVDYAWSRLNGETTESLGHGVSPTLQTRLNDGDSIIQLLVTDNQGNTATDTVLITINASTVVITTLGNLPGLTPNQKRTADALDRVCEQLRNGDGQLSANQQDLLNRCNGLQMDNTTANQVSALDEIVADDFAVARTQTLLFANTQYAGVMDRLMALRGGAKGLSLAGLNIIVDGSPVPLAQLQQMAKGLLGGGASADEPGGLLNDKWGLWARGNYSFGEKDRSTNSPGFDADQWAMVGGVDYRYNDEIVGGVSLAYGESGIEFDGGEGGLDTTTWAVSLYGSSYVAKKFYFDAIINVANADYGADRNIAYVDGAGLVDVDARGDTVGMTYSAGISGGRDFLYGGFTLSPTLGLFYIDATIDKFTERGASGLNLIYDEQSFQSFTGNFGFRVTYAWNLSWGVVMPHLRVDYVREFKNDVDVFGVRFAADPNAMSAPPILVETDNPDESYWRLATGFSTQFVDGISGYVEYQRLESFEFISFQDVSMGLRFQKSF